MSLDIRGCTYLRSYPLTLENFLVIESSEYDVNLLKLQYFYDTKIL